MIVQASVRCALAAVALSAAALPVLADDQTTAQRAVEWLAVNQNLDGSWCNSEEMKAPCTSEAVLALKNLGYRNTAYFAGLTWIENHNSINTDYRARALAALVDHGDDISDHLTKLGSSQRSGTVGNSGWGLSGFYDGDPLDTALVLRAYSESATTAGISAAIGYLQSSQLPAPNRGWAVSNRGLQSEVDDVVTAEVVRTLVLFNASEPSLTTHINEAIAMLTSRVTTSAPVLTKAHTALALLGRDNDSLHGRDLLDSLALAQGANGSWNNEPYLTALAANAFSLVIRDGAASNGEIVHIADPELRRALNRALGKNDGDAITRGDLSRLTSLDLSGLNITDLTGLQYAVNLTYVNLSFNQITSLTPLVGLPQFFNALFDGNPLSSTADADGDGLNDQAELQAGTSPLNPDSDGDTIPDGIDPLPLTPTQFPTTQPDSGTVNEDGSVIVNVIANDSDPDGDPLTIDQVTQPAHGSASFNAASGTVTYAPAAEYSGSDSFTYWVNDGRGARASGAVNITVVAVNDAPSVTTNAGLTVLRSSTQTIGTSALSASDVDDAANQVTYQVATLPASGTILYDGVAASQPVQFTQDDVVNGRVSYAHSGSAGANDAFTFSLRDAAGTYSTVCTAGTPCTFAITVSGNPWMTKLHQGDIHVEPHPVKVRVSWSAVAGKTYDLCVSANASTDAFNCAGIAGNQYFSGLSSSTPQPFTVGGLTTGVPVYLSLRENGALKAWTAATPNAMGFSKGGYINGTGPQVIAADGTRYVGGTFSTVGVVTGAGVTLAPTSAAGTGHALAFPAVNGPVEAAIPDGNGGWYIAGSFTLVGGQVRQRLAQVDRLGRVTNWNPTVGGALHALAWSGDTVYVGSEGGALMAFDTVSAAKRWERNVGGPIVALAADAGVVYVGGEFSIPNGPWYSFSHKGVAAFDTAGAITSWAPWVEGSVYSLAVDGGVVYIGGAFSSVAGVNRSALAAVTTDGAVTDWNPGAGGAVHALAVKNGVIYAGGGFTSAGGGSGTQATRTRLAAFDTSGALLSWAPGVDEYVAPYAWVPVYPRVKAIAVSNGTVYVAGWFYKAFGTGGSPTTRNYLAAFDAGSGALRNWNPSADYVANALAVSGDVLYAGGMFGIAGMNWQRNNLAAFDATGSPTTWNPGASDSVHTLAMLGNTIYAGGIFTSAGGGTGTQATRNRLAAFDVSGTLASWNPGANGGVNSLAIGNGVIYAGGAFTTAGGGTGAQATRKSLAAFDSSGTLTSWNPGANDVVTSLELFNGLVYAGGWFTAAGGGTATTARQHLAAFTTTGALNTWNPGTDNDVFDLASCDGVLYAAGSFTMAGGGGTGTVARNRLAAFDTAGVLAGWNPGADSDATNLLCHGGSIYAGGSFENVGGGTGTTARSRVAAFTPLGNVTSWAAFIDGYTSSIAGYGSTIHVTGNINAVGASATTMTDLRRHSASFVDSNYVAPPPPSDSIPDPFVFVDKTGVVRSSTQISNTITITGINTTAGVTVTGGTYSKWNPATQTWGAFTSASGTAVAGDQFRVSHVAASTYLTSRHTTLNVGGVADTFTTTTRDAIGGGDDCNPICQ